METKKKKTALQLWFYEKLNKTCQTLGTAAETGRDSGSVFRAWTQIIGLLASEDEAVYLKRAINIFPLAEMLLNH